MSLVYKPQWNNETNEYCDVPNLFIKFSKKNNKTYKCQCGMEKRYFDTDSQYKAHIARRQHKEFICKKTIDKLRDMRLKERNMRIEERNNRKDAEGELEKEICKAKTIQTKKLDYDKETEELDEKYLRDIEDYELRCQEQCEEARQTCDAEKKARIRQYKVDRLSSKRKRDEDD
tara:strand:+ start:1088 stop:1609 length:522 start_codon:yes stop_codon:yes gene_type:complete